MTENSETASETENEHPDDVSGVRITSVLDQFQLQHQGQPDADEVDSDSFYEPHRLRRASLNALMGRE